MNDPPGTSVVDAPAAVKAIVARGLVKQYDRGLVVALAGLDLDVESGEFVAICGPSGCGKSSLLNIIAAIDRPDSGEIRVLGKALSTLDDPSVDQYRRGTVGLVFQLHNLLPNLTAIENVQTPMLANGVPPAERRDRARALLERVGLADRLNARPATLSGGERQRVAVARALANRPRILLADEPTGALDSRSGDHLFDLLQELQADLNMTLLVVTHDVRVAGRAGRVIHMLDGRVVNGDAA